MAKQPRRTLADALGQEGQGAQSPEEVTALVAVQEPKRDTVTSETKRTSIYLPKAVHRQLKELAFANDRKMHDYILEGLDLVFRQHGLRSIRSLTKSEK